MGGAEEAIAISPGPSLRLCASEIVGAIQSLRLLARPRQSRPDAHTRHLAGLVGWPTRRTPESKRAGRGADSRLHRTAASSSRSESRRAAPRPVHYEGAQAPARN